MKYMKCVTWYKGAADFFPNNIYLSNYHFTHREKPIIRLYDRLSRIVYRRKLLKNSGTRRPFLDVIELASMLSQSSRSKNQHVRKKIKMGGNCHVKENYV
jgi:hypothetical protein